jgi:two-component system LytT family sensor kinase
MPPMHAFRQKARQLARAYFWSMTAWGGFAPVLAAQDKVRSLAQGINWNYWTLVLVNGAWLLTAAILTPPLFSMVRRYPVAKPTDFGRIAAYLFGIVPYVIATVCLRWTTLPPWNSSSQQFGPRTFHDLLTNTYHFANIIWDYSVIIFAAHAYEYLRRTRAQELERAELRQALAASELQALKSQIHPHFLFNTLQGISTLMDKEKSRAKAMLLKLSTLLRTALAHGSTDLITFDDELTFIKDYLDLEKMRLEQRLDVRWSIAPETRQMLVPQMVLQPLVENAILHGVACCREGGWIELSSNLNQHALEVQVRNSVGAKSRGGLGLGITNTKARLKFLYTEEATFSFTLAERGIATATLVLPSIGARPCSSPQEVVSLSQPWMKTP